MSQQTECGRSWGQTRDYKIGIYCFATTQATLKRNSKSVCLVQNEVVIISSHVTFPHHDIAEILLCFWHLAAITHFPSTFIPSTDTVHKLLTLISIKKNRTCYLESGLRPISLNPDQINKISLKNILKQYSILLGRISHFYMIPALKKIVCY